jgi:hypothetical protein
MPILSKTSARADHNTCVAGRTPQHNHASGQRTAMEEG